MLIPFFNQRNGQEQINDVILYMYLEEISIAYYDDMLDK